MQLHRSENAASQEKRQRALALMLRGYGKGLKFSELQSVERIRALEERQRLLEEAAAAAQIGIWACELPFETLTWTGGVYDIFELPQGFRVSREETLGFYTDESRKMLEEVRSRAIRECGGFTLDTEITTALGKPRLMRITATVEYENNVPARIFGIKQDVTRSAAFGH
jgi:PAS domain-containing protein